MENIQGDIRFDFKNNCMSQKSSRWKDSWDISSQCSLKILFSLPMWIAKIWKEKKTKKQKKGPKRRAMPSLLVFHKQLTPECVCAWYTAWLLPCDVAQCFFCLVDDTGCPSSQSVSPVKTPSDTGHSPIGFCPGSDEDFTRKKCRIGTVAEGSVQAARYKKESKGGVIKPGKCPYYL